MGKVCTAQKGEGVREGEREKSAKGAHSPIPAPIPLPTNPYPLSTPARQATEIYTFLKIP